MMDRYYKTKQTGACMNQQRVEDVKQRIVKLGGSRPYVGDLMQRLFKNEHDPKATERYIREAMKQLVAEGKYIRTTSAAVGGNAGNMTVWCEVESHKKWLNDCKEFQRRIAEVYGAANV
jgi:hypothetical protein